jgi:hypothetical protein
MSRTKTNTDPGKTATQPGDPVYKNVPEVDARIDAYIRENPKYWAYLQAMPRERMERSMVLNELQKLDRQQRIRDGLMKDIQANPQLKEAYETLVKNVPEERREAVMAQLARQTRVTLARAQGPAQETGIKPG